MTPNDWIMNVKRVDIECSGKLWIYKAPGTPQKCVGRKTKL